MSEAELKYKHALIQLGNVFDALFTQNARVEMLQAELDDAKRRLEEYEKTTDSDTSDGGDQSDGLCMAQGRRPNAVAGQTLQRQTAADSRR